MNETVLVADDSIATQRLCEMALTKEGFKVVTVGSGADALDHVRQKKPDIALIDAIMPGLDGYQVCKTLKQTKEFGNLPIVLLAGTFEDFDEKKGKQSGADAILNKPCKPQILVSKVKELLLARKSKSAPEVIASKPQGTKTKAPTDISKQSSKEKGLASRDEEELTIKEVRREIYEPKFEEEFAEEDLEVLEEEFRLEEAEAEQAQPVGKATSEVIQEPAAVEEDLEFDEPGTEQALEEEILEEVLPEEGIAEEEAEEELVEEEAVVSEEFQEEEPQIEEFLEEEPVEEVVPEGKGLQEKSIVEEVTTPEPQKPSMALSAERMDAIADQIAEKVAGKLLPLLSQELANYLIRLPIFEHVIRNLSQKLVEEILPELERKK
ncbi:MAG TPA: response regulator [Candidatus Limnocylindrales bacterium]|nr:response regulator [Candidatus Limnocylindrales bacterium]